MPPLVPLLLVSAALLSGTRHPASASRTHVLVEGSRAELWVECQSLSLIEALPQLDGNRDQFLELADLEANRAEVEDYFLRTVGLLVTEDGEERELAADFAGVELLPEPVAGPFGLQWMRVRLEYDEPRDLGSFVVVTAAFHERNPWHQDHVLVDWNGEAFERRVPEQERRTLFEPAHVRRPQVLRSGFQSGFGALARQWTAGLFVLTLVLASMTRRALIPALAVYLGAASLALQLGARGLVDVPSRFVVLAAALSTAYLAADALVRRAPRNPWIEALGFGLLFGLLWGEDHAALDPDPVLFSTSLLGYHLGIVTVLGLLGLGFSFSSGFTSRPAAGEIPRTYRPLGRVLLGACLVTGLAGFVLLTGWV